MNKTINDLACRMGLAAIAIVGTSAAARDVAAAEDGIEPNAIGLEEVVVTAQKRVERLIEAPQSVTVLSADDLTNLGATDFRDFADTIPGLNFYTAGPGFTGISIRGVTTGVDTLASVGTYVDEVPYGSSTIFGRGGQLRLDVGLSDIDRIEVLRGPQGTLYGASTMGGLVKYVTKQPDSRNFGADMRAGLSSTQHGGVNYDGAFALNMPLVTDRAALRMSGSYARDGGYIDNLALGENDVNSSDAYSGRVDLLLTPSETFSVRVVGYLQETSADGFPMALFNTAGTPVDTDLEQRRLVSESFDQSFRLLSATLSYDLGAAELTSVSSFQTVDTDFVADISPVLLPFAQLFGATAVGSPVAAETDKFTQEVRLASTGTRTLEWLIGGFYTRETSKDASAFPLYDAGGQLIPFDFGTSSSSARYEEYAAFGDVTWRLTERFDVTGGVRYASSRQKFSVNQSGFLAVPDHGGRSDESVFTYLANARYHLNDHATAYVRYATGYRPGGPNPQARDLTTGLIVVIPPFEADRLKSYEIGFKAETSDRRFGLDMAGYFIDWNNIILTRVFNGFPSRINAPDGATVRGGELTLTAAPTAGLRLTGAFGYQDAKLSEQFPTLGEKGERMPDVPRFTAALNAHYELPVGNLQPTVGASVRYVDERTTAFANQSGRPYYWLPDYTTFDLYAGLTVNSVALQVYVHNLFDERSQHNTPLNSGFPKAGPLGVAIGQPRTVGLTASMKF